jgi:hypothetical protein
MTFHESLDENNNPEVIEKLRDTLRGYSFSTKMEMCRNISHLIDNYFPDDYTDDSVDKRGLKKERKLAKKIYDTCHLHEVDLIALLAIIDSENDNVIELNKCNQFVEIINLIRSYVIAFAHKNDSEISKVMDGHAVHWDEVSDMLFLRISMQQFPYQQNFILHLYRYKWFYSYKTSNFDLADMFLKKFYYTFDEYILVCLFLFFISRERNSVLTISHVLGQFSTQKKFKAEAIVVILNQLCETRQTLSDNYYQLKSDDSRLINYDFNPLKITPLIIDGDNFYAPVPQLLFQAVTKGFYHRLCDEYKRESFRQHFGKEVFEPYVEHVLTWDEVDYAIVPEFPYYKSKQEQLSADFILIRENDLILVEVKGTAPSASLSSTDLKEFKSQLNKAYAEGVTQCAKKEDDIRNGILTHDKIPNVINKIHYLVVTLEDFYFLPTESVAKRIREYASNKNVTIPENKFFHLMSINTLEAIIENDTRSLFDFLLYRENSNHTFTVATWLDINNQKKTSELRSIQYLNRVLKTIKTP